MERLQSGDNRIRIPMRLCRLRIPILHITRLPGSCTTGNSGAPVFEAIAPIGYALNLVGEVPWIRATSGPLDGLRSAGLPRNVNGDSEDLLTHAPAIMPTSSMRVEIDFIRPENVVDRRDNSSGNSYGKPWVCVSGLVTSRRRSRRCHGFILVERPLAKRAANWGNA